MTTFSQLMDERRAIITQLKSNPGEEEQGRLLLRLGQILDDPATEPFSRGWASGSTEVTSYDLAAVDVADEVKRQSEWLNQGGLDGEFKAPLREGRR